LNLVNQEKKTQKAPTQPPKQEAFDLPKQATWG
jgi:hypothetical protein